MQNRAAIIGAGVSGLTCGVVFAEHEWNVAIFADEAGQRTTSATAAAVWFPYDAEPAEKIIPWALTTYERSRDLSRDLEIGASMIEIQQFTRTGALPIPAWAENLGARSLSVISSESAGPARTFASGYAPKKSTPSLRAPAKSELYPRSPTAALGGEFCRKSKD